MIRITNAFGTISAIISAVLLAMVNIFHCAEPATAGGVATCSASWLSPQMAGYVIIVFSLLQLLNKAIRPGGFFRGLFGSTAVIVPYEKAGVGTVTTSQVNSPK